jgi:hypothetical protein
MVYIYYHFSLQGPQELSWTVKGFPTWVEMRKISAEKIMAPLLEERPVN